MHHVAVTLSACLAVVGLGELLGSTLAEETTTVSASSLYTGVVMELSGAPAVDCRVWLIRHSEPNSSDVVEEVRTDREGRFRLNTPRSESRWLKERELLFVVARDSQGRFADADWCKLTDDASRSEVEPKLLLFELSDYHGRLVDSGGRAIAGAVIEPLFLFHPLPRCIATEMGTATASDGTFTLKVVPERYGKKAFAAAEIAAEEFGRVTASWNFDKPVTLQLEKPGCVCGSLACDSNPTAVAGIALELVAIESETTDDRDYSFYYHGRAVTQPDGKFRFDGVVPGKYRIGIVTNDPLPYDLDSITPFEVKSGQSVSKPSVPMKQKLQLRGTVVDASTGAGIKGAEISVRQLNDNESNRWERPSQTDERGAFVAYAFPGKVSISLAAVPDEYRWAASRQDAWDVEVATDTTLPPVRLQRTPVVEGLVVDESGRPVPDAQVLTLTDGHLTTDDCRFTTDAQGKFRLTGLLINEPISLRVATAKAATNGPVMIDPRGPIRIAISPEYAFAIRGVLHDDQGQPIVGSDVNLRAGMTTDSSSIEFGLAQTLSDSEGKFEFLGLWPGDEYSIRVNADGYECAETLDVKGEAGRMHDIGSLKMNATSGFVEGHVIDSAGKAIAGVRVFNTGDAPKTVGTTSDSEGRFRLDGLRHGPVFEFAEQPGCRFTGMRTNSGDTDVKIKLLREDDPIPSSALGPAPDTLEEQRKLARYLLEKLWAHREHGRVRVLIRVMNQIDPEQARNWATEAGELRDKVPSEEMQLNVARYLLAYWVATLDPKMALRVLGPKPQPEDQLNGFRWNSEVSQLAADICLDYPDRALELVNELEGWNAERAKLRIAWRWALTRQADAVRLVESIPSPYAATALGWMALRIAPRDKAAASSLIDKALSKLAEPPTSPLDELGLGGRPVELALLAVQASQVGYQDMDGIVYRVLASRATSKDGFSPANAVESNVIMAGLLGMVHVPSARHVLESIEQYDQIIGSDQRSNAPPDWLEAWLLTDTGRGRELLDRALADFAAKPNADAFDSLLRTALMLAAPREKKIQCLLRHDVYWNPEDDLWFLVLR